MRPISAAIARTLATSVTSVMTPSEREAITTSAPASRKATTSAAPIPRLPPVTTATLPSRRKASSTPLTGAPPGCLKPHGRGPAGAGQALSRMDHALHAAGILATGLQGVLRRIELVVTGDYGLQVDAPVGRQRARGRVGVGVAECPGHPDLARLNLRQRQLAGLARPQPR